MFSLMGNCCSCIKGRNSEPRKAISIAVLGLDGAGKTTATKALVGDSLEVTPTIGFNSEQLKLKNFDITFFDLGGGKKIRDIWQQYLHEVYGVIYMVDSTGVDRFEEVRDNLETLLSHQLVTGKPLLIFANKNDMKEAMETIDVCEQLSIETIVNDNKCPCRIEACSAIKGSGRKIDRTIKEGLLWLVGMIEHNWDMYKKRVDNDVEEYKIKEAEEKEARRERVRKKREERERQEEEERQRLGIEPPKDDEEGDDMVDGDPFKRLSITDLEKKEKKLKEEKAKRKELEAHLRENEMKSMMEEKKKDENDSDDLTIPRSNRSLTKRFNLFDDDFLSNKTTNANRDDDDDDADSDIIISSRNHRATSRLPPIQQPIGTKFMEETTVKKKKSKKNKKLKALTEVDNEPMKMDDYSFVSHEKSVGSLSKIEVERVNSAMNNGYDSSDNNDSDYLDDRILRNESMKRSSQRSNFSFDNPNYGDFSTHNSGLGNLENDNSEEEVKDLYSEINKSNNQKKSKKKSKKNRKQFEDSTDFSGSATRKEESDEDIFRVPRRKLPSLDGGEDIDTTAVRKLKTKKKNYLRKNKTSPSDDDERSLPDRQGTRDFSWTLSPKRESNIRRSNPSWGFVEDLDREDESDYENSQQRSKPNMDDDDDDIMY